MTNQVDSKSQRNRGFWLTPKELSWHLPDSTGRSICYELSATGSIHAGSLRALHFVEKVQQASTAVGKSLKYYLRLNDLAPAKSDSGENTAALSAGAPIAAEVRGEDGRTMTERLKEEVDIIYKRTGWTPPQVILVSEVYRSERFVKCLDSVLRDTDLIVGTLAKFKKSPVSLYSPICPCCHRVRSSHHMKLDSNKSLWECCACRANFEFFPGRSLGLITFKLEQALMWRFCCTAVDVHGQDHAEAFNASCELMRALNWGDIPLAGRVNLVVNQHGAKLSKSRRNGKPVAELPTDDLKELLGMYEKTPYWRPIVRHEDV